MNLSDNTLSLAASMLGQQALTYIAWITGAIIALVRWRRHPTVSLLTVIALGTMLALSLAGVGIHTLVRGGGSFREHRALLTMWGLVHSTVYCGCWALIIVALFGWRGTAPAAAAAPGYPGQPPYPPPAPGAPAA
jgi:hypothetical protein